ncbi:uncharacterized protein LOC117921272 [Vitis riparia]|uniref:uncharacterized protein LOC117921272 n=1 Tax=Vitis riparia TaxID=96939 RepID=UPI00155B0227|nr:uncharacterized protein LOC117921272 [Vitis riparia]
MKIYHKNSQFLHNLIVYSLTSLVCSLFFSYPHWFPSLWLSINHFLFTSLPNIWSFFFNPKCIFLVGNTIILFLIGEWKLLGSQSPAAEIYDEYAERSRASRRVLSALQEAKEMELEKNLVEESLHKVEEEKEEKEEEEEKDGDEDGEEDQPGLPAEELNKRVEEFIARINKQRWLEAKLLVHDDSSPEDMQF